MIFETAGVMEAVALAQEMKRSGQYNWFRGQQRNWRVMSTLARKPEEERPRAWEAFKRFCGWLQSQPGLAQLGNHVHSVYAIAQHYGMPTQYVDFTTDPAIAGFFAAGGEADPDERSCIVLLNTDDLLEFWKVMPERYPPPEPITIDVPNLWRLEAQRGVFLYCPYPEFDLRIYSFDRILFPSGGTIAAPTRDEIYPRKSALEILLDQYFMNESLLKSMEMSREIMTSMRMIQFDDADDYDPDGIVDGGLPPEPSWNDIGKWQSIERESFSDAYTDDRVTLTIRSSVPASAHAETAREMLSILEARPGLRNRLVKFDVAAERAPESVARLAPFLEKVWDGMRRLPYRDVEIAWSIGTIVGIALASGRAGDYLDRPVQYPGNVIEVEFGSDDGSYSRAFVPEEELLEAVRGDVLSWVRPEYVDDVRGNVTPMLQFVRRPDLLFQFDAFRDVFGRWLIPSQVLMRPQPEEHDAFRRAIFYNPARLTRFGLP